MNRCFGSGVLAFVALLLPAALASQSADSERHVNSRPSLASGCGGFGTGAARGGEGTGSALKADATAHGFDVANLDRSVSPCENFYQFAVGSWIKNNPIPPDRSDWGLFAKLQDRNEEALHQILEEAARDKSAAPGSNWQKIGDFYASCMDEGQIETAGLKPLAPELQRIAEIRDTAGLQAEIARLQSVGVNAVRQIGNDAA